jgi:hypothetical protein
MTDTSNTVTCGYCGAANPADAEICQRCGASLAAYRPIETASASADFLTPGSASIGVASPVAEAELPPATVVDTPPRGAAPSPHDARPTSHFRHVTYTRPDAGSSSPRPPSAGTSPTGATPEAPTPAPIRRSPAAPPTGSSSVTFQPPTGRTQPAPTTSRVSNENRLTGPVSQPPRPVASSPPPAQRPARGQSAVGKRDEARTGPTAQRPQPYRRPDRLARSSASTLITWGVGLVLFGFIISIALPNASHQALGEVVVTVTTVVGVVLFIVGLTHRTGARHPADRRPRRRR